MGLLLKSITYFQQFILFKRFDNKGDAFWLSGIFKSGRYCQRRIFRYGCVSCMVIINGCNGIQVILLHGSVKEASSGFFEFCRDPLQFFGAGGIGYYGVKQLLPVWGTQRTCLLYTSPSPRDP